MLEMEIYRRNHFNRVGKREKVKIIEVKKSKEERENSRATPKYNFKVIRSSSKSDATVIGKMSCCKSKDTGKASTRSEASGTGARPKKETVNKIPVIGNMGVEDAGFDHPKQFPS